MTDKPDENERIIAAIVDAIGTSRRELLMNVEPKQMRDLLSIRLKKALAPTA